MWMLESTRAVTLQRERVAEDVRSSHRAEEAAAGGASPSSRTAAEARARSQRPRAGRPPRAALARLLERVVSDNSAGTDTFRAPTAPPGESALWALPAAGSTLSAHGPAGRDGLLPVDRQDGAARDDSVPLFPAGRRHLSTAPLAPTPAPPPPSTSALPPRGPPGPPSTTLPPSVPPPRSPPPAVRYAIQLDTERRASALSSAASSLVIGEARVEAFDVWVARHLRSRQRGQLAPPVDVPYGVSATRPNAGGGGHQHARVCSPPHQPPLHRRPLTRPSAAVDPMDGVFAAPASLVAELAPGSTWFLALLPL